MFNLTVNFVRILLNLQISISSIIRIVNLQAYNWIEHKSSNDEICSEINYNFGPDLEYEGCKLDSMSDYILGISAFYHDSAAVLLKDGEILAAAQEERFTRKKHDYDFPTHAVNYCLKEAQIKADQLKYITFYDKPFIKFNRILETYLTYAPKGILSFVKAIPLWIRKKLWILDLIAKETNFDGTILFPEHHESHAASAFFPSPYRSAAFLTMDGVGEWATSSFGIGEDNHVKILSELYFPHLLGFNILLYLFYRFQSKFRWI